MYRKRRATKVSAAEWRALAAAEKSAYAKKRRKTRMESLGVVADPKVVRDTGSLGYVATRPFANIAIDNSTDNTNAAVLNSTLRGDAFYNRSGNKSFGKYLWLRGRAYRNTSGLARQLLRVVVVFDKNSNAALPTAGFADIMTDYDRSGTTAADILARRSHSTIDRYVTLLDKTWALSEDASTDGNYIEEFIKLRGAQTVFSGNSGGIGDISSGAILIYAISDAATNGPSLEMRCTYCYADK